MIFGQLPAINLDAEDYTRLIDWSQACITEPLLTASLSESELCSVGETVPSYPVHTQAVERAVRRDTSRVGSGWTKRAPRLHMRQTQTSYSHASVRVETGF